MRLTLRYGAKSAEYDVRESARLTAKLRIHVEPSGALVVEAPVGTPENKIRAGVQKRARWIMDHIDRFADYRQHALRRDYCSDVLGVASDAEKQWRLARVQPGQSDEAEPRHLRHAALGSRKAELVEDAEGRLQEGQVPVPLHRSGSRRRRHEGSPDRQVGASSSAPLRSVAAR